MLFTDEKPNRCISGLIMIGLYCEMKLSREEGKTLISGGDAMCVCALKDASLYHQYFILEQL